MIVALIILWYLIGVIGCLIVEYKIAGSVSRGNLILILILGGFGGPITTTLGIYTLHGIDPIDWIKSVNDWLCEDAW